MSAEFKVTAEDFVACGLLHGRMNRKTLLVHGAIDIALVVAGLVLLWLGQPTLATICITVGIAAALVPWVLVRTLIPWSMKRHYAKYPKIHRAMQIDLRADGVRLTSGEDGGTLKWDEMVRWRQDNDYLLLYSSPRIYHMVPKRITADGFPIERFISLLNENVGSPL